MNQGEWIATWIAILAIRIFNPGLKSGLKSRLPGCAAGISGKPDNNPDCQGVRLAVCMT
jgi:hypothetical protein